MELMTAKTMAEVLAEHAFTERDSFYCQAEGCWWHYEPEDDLDRLIAEHQQDMLIAAGFGLVADAKAEALEEAAELIKPFSGIGMANGATRADVSEWLAKRAEQFRNPS